jgi:hypothetical protein
MALLPANPKTLKLLQVLEFLEFFEKKADFYARISVELARTPSSLFCSQYCSSLHNELKLSENHPEPLSIGVDREKFSPHSFNPFYTPLNVNFYHVTMHGEHTASCLWGFWLSWCSQRDERIQPPDFATTKTTIVAINCSYHVRNN